MLATLLIWIYTALLSFIYGLGCVLLLRKTFHFEEDQLPSFSLISIAGLVIITTLAGFLSLLINLGLAANLVLALIGIGILVLARSRLPIRYGCAMLPELVRCQYANQRQPMLVCSSAMYPHSQPRSPHARGQP